MKPVAMGLVLLMFNQIVHAGDICSSEVLKKNGNYVGCKTNVNGHIHISNKKGLTELGCSSFCRSLQGTNSELKSSSFSYEESGDFSSSHRNCNAEKLVDRSGNYIGCRTDVGGHIQTSNNKSLTALGCETFCQEQENLMNDSLPSNMKRISPDRIKPKEHGADSEWQ